MNNYIPKSKSKKVKKEETSAPASITEDKAKKAEIFIKQALEPKMKDIVENANEFLKKYGIRVGATIEWYIDKTEEEEKE